VSDPQPRRRRPGWQALLLAGLCVVALGTGGTALALRMTASPPAGDDVALVATTPATLQSGVSVSDVRLTGGGASVPLAGAQTAKIAPDYAALGNYDVPSGHYTGVTATIGGNTRSARLDVDLVRGRLTPILLVARPDSLTATAGNDATNQALLVAAGQFITPPDVTFTDQHGNAVPLHSLKGKVVVVAALDTHCHDTCPLYTALWADLDSVIRERGWQDRVAIAEVSMDPGRDTPAELLAYARLTGATWPLLRSDVAATFQFWLSLHASYSRGAAPSPDPTDWYTGQPEAYHLDHDSLAVVLDQNGTARYILQGNPGLGHALSPALQALMDPAKLPGLQQTAAWTITDLLDRVDAILGAPPESSRGTEAAARVGARVPQFSLPGLDGRQVSVQSQLGRPTVVTFWATWCTACRQDFPALAAAAKAHANLSILAVDEAESAASVRDYLHSLLGADAARFTALLDADSSVGGRYALPGLPVTVFVGADGIVQQVSTGVIQGDVLARGLAAIGA